jgi:hypothetical protein
MGGVGSRQMAVGVCLIVASSAVLSVEVCGESAGQDAVPRRFALLVGCGDYPSLPPWQQLAGPPNDVRIVQRALVECFAFPADQIRVLADGTTNRDPDHWPTRERIIRGFQWLREVAQPGDQMFVLLAGHGSQQPDLDGDPEIDPEPDGLDEIFLPRDIGRWEGQTGFVENAIVDDEIRAWLTEIVGRGAFVFFVADTCHAGTLTRGGDDEVVRQVSPRDLGISPEALDSAAAQAAHVRDGVAERQDWYDLAQIHQDGRGVVALYAAQSDQAAIEQRMPGGIRYGRLSYTLCEIFEQTNRAISYRELEQRVLWKHTREGWIDRSTPWLEGTHPTQQVLGATAWPERSRLVMTRQPDGAYRVQAGTLAGVTVGSVLRVMPPAGAGDENRLLGHVQITAAQLLQATAQPVAYRGIAAVEELPDLSRCEIEFRELGDLMLTVGLSPEGDAALPRNDGASEQLVSVLRDLAGQRDAVIRLREPRGEQQRGAEADAAADWYPEIRGDQVYLRRGDTPRSLSPDDAQRTGRLLGPFEVDERLKASLGECLKAVARASNLVKLAERPELSERSPIRIETTLEKNGQRFELAGAEASRVRNKDVVSLHIRNTGRQQVSVVVFYVDNHYGIKVFFPLSEGDERMNAIPPDQTLTKPIRFRINDNTLGWEHMIVVALGAEHRAAIDELRNLEQGDVYRGLEN